MVISFHQVYEEIRDKESILGWLSVSTSRYEKQETIARMFVVMGILPAFQGYEACEGNFNLMTVRPISNIDSFWNSSVKDSGDSSDITLRSLTNPCHYIACSSKNRSESDHRSIHHLDLEKMHFYASQYKQCIIDFCIIIDDKLKLIESINNSHSSSGPLKKHLQRAILVDWNDLNNAFVENRALFANPNPSKLLSFPVISKIHQKYTVETTKRLLQTQDSILWGHICRSGKSFMMFRLIEELPIHNVLFITTMKVTLNTLKDDASRLAPSFTPIVFDSTTTSIPSGKTIVFVTKQYLHTKITESTTNDVLSSVNFDIRFIDEAHSGGTTTLSEDVCHTYAKGCQTIFTTATYSKVLTKFNIPNPIFWDMEDNNLGKRFEKDPEFATKRWKEKYGELFVSILSRYSPRSITKMYEHVPDLEILVPRIDHLYEKALMDKGFSMEKVFSLVGSGDGFVNDGLVKHLIRYLFGYGTIEDELGIIESEVGTKDDDSVMTYIRTKQTLKPRIILCFLPCGQGFPIAKISRVYKAIIEEEVGTDYEVIAINSTDSDSEGDPLETIRGAFHRSNIKGKSKGLIVLAGRMLTTGATLRECDVVINMSQMSSMDMYFQSTLRASTEDSKSGKKTAYLIDFNIQRVAKMIVETSQNICPGKSDLEAVEYLLSTKLLNFRSFHGVCTMKDKDVHQTAKDIYKEWSNCIKQDMSTFVSSSMGLGNSYFSDHLKTMAMGINLPKGSKGTTKELSIGEHEGMPKGVEIVFASKEYLQGEATEVTIPQKIMVDLMNDVFKYVVPSCTLLTLKQTVSSFDSIIKVVWKNSSLKELIMDYINHGVGIRLPEDKIYKLIIGMTNEINNDKTYAMRLEKMVNTIRTLFQESQGNRDEFARLLTDTLTPSTNERQNLAEVSTPQSTRLNMLREITRMDPDFFKSPKTILDPCVGKASFPVDIVRLFHQGMSESYPDPEERLKVILENLYMIDVNPLNCHVTRMCLDPEDKGYKLNIQEGDALEMNTKALWGIQQFDLVIANPPYMTDPSKQNTMPIYNKFVEHFWDRCRMMSMITPSRWFCGGKGLDKFRKFMLGRTDIVSIRHERDASKIFGNNVEIKGGVSYFTKDSLYNGMCDYNGTFTDLTLGDSLIDPRYISLGHALKQFDSLKDIYMTAGWYRVRPNDKRLHDERTLTDAPCLVSKLKKMDRLRYIDESHIATRERTWKVVTAEAAGKGHSPFGFMKVSHPEEVYTDSYFGFRTQNQSEAESLMSYLRTKLANRMLAIKKISQHISEKTISLIPLPPLDRLWDDQQVYEYFHLSPEDIKLVEEPF